MSCISFTIRLICRFTNRVCEQLAFLANSFAKALNCSEDSDKVRHYDLCVGFGVGLITAVCLALLLYAFFCSSFLTITSEHCRCCCSSYSQNVLWMLI